MAEQQNPPEPVGPQPANDPEGTVEVSRSKMDLSLIKYTMWSILGVTIFFSVS